MPFAEPQYDLGEVGGDQHRVERCDHQVYAQRVYEAFIEIVPVEAYGDRADLSLVEGLQQLYWRFLEDAHDQPQQEDEQEQDLEFPEQLHHLAHDAAGRPEYQEEYEKEDESDS